jgi:hypothetical protein
VLSIWLRAYKHEIICDLAQYYHIYDYHTYKPSYIYILVDGLEDNSRFKLKLNGMKTTMDTMLSAIACDYLAKLWWSKTEDAEHGRNKPISILSQLLEEDTQKHEEDGFESAEEFNKARSRLLRKEE